MSQYSAATLSYPPAAFRTFPFAQATLHHLQKHTVWAASAMVMSLPRWLLLSGKSSFVNCSCMVADSIAVLAVLDANRSVLFTCSFCSRPVFIEMSHDTSYSMILCGASFVNIYMLVLLGFCFGDKNQNLIPNTMILSCWRALAQLVVLCKVLRCCRNDISALLSAIFSSNNSCNANANRKRISH